MTLREFYGWGSSKGVSDQILGTCLDRGRDYVDTANAYTGGEADAEIQLSADRTTVSVSK